MRWVWLLSLGAHAVLMLVFVGLDSRMRRDLPAPTPQPDTIEIEIAPPAPAPEPAVAPPPGPIAALAQVPARPPAVQPARPQRAPAPAQPSPPMRAPPAHAPAARPPAVRTPAVPAPPTRAPLAGAPDTPTPPDTPGPPDAPAAAASALSMRSSAHTPGPGEPRPRQPDVDLSPAHVARLVAPDPGPAPYSPLDLPGPPPEAPDVRDGWMPIGGGNHAVANAAFTARIARDGQVTIEDKPSFQITPRRPDVGTDFSNEYTGQGAPQAYLKMDLATFDVTDWVMRMAGMDPYSSRKLLLLDQTREVRAEMRARARVEDLRDAIALLPRLLDQIWHEPGVPAAERRELLFRIWDECAELGPDEDDALGRASRTARATVLGYIRRTLPAGSPDAYPEAELEALNARRRSAERFAPYP
jgi:hypothetical protein